MTLNTPLNVKLFTTHYQRSLFWYICILKYFHIENFISCFMKQFQAPFCQIKTSWRKLQQLDTSLKKKHNICLDEAIILCCLSQRCKCQGDVAGETGLTATQASRMLSRLENKSLIIRTIAPEDKRKMIFALTQDGENKLKEITPEGINFLEL